MAGEYQEMNLAEAIRDALNITLEKDPTSSKKSKFGLFHYLGTIVKTEICTHKYIHNILTSQE